MASFQDVCDKPPKGPEGPPRRCHSHTVGLTLVDLRVTFQDVQGLSDRRESPLTLSRTVVWRKMESEEDTTFLPGTPSALGLPFLGFTEGTVCPTPRMPALPCAP